MVFVMTIKHKINLIEMRCSSGGRAVVAFEKLVSKSFVTTKKDLKETSQKDARSSKITHVSYHFDQIYMLLFYFCTFYSFYGLALILGGSLLFMIEF